MREVPECVSEFQLTAPAQLRLGLRRVPMCCSVHIFEPAFCRLRIFFFRGKPLDLDLGSGPQKKVEFTLSSRQDRKLKSCTQVRLQQ